MISNVDPRAFDYGVNVVHSVCCLAGVPSYVDDLRSELRDSGVLAAVNDHNTARLFDWLMSILSFQGIANRVAEDFIHRHGNVGWFDVEQALAASPCPTLGGYWLFHDCRYHKTSGTCAEPDHFAACPLPRHPLRNGHLNQTAYSLALFIRDIAGGDLVNWIDQQLAAGDTKSAMTLASARDALIGPLRNVYGVSDKVLAMALAGLLMGGAGKRRRLWFQVGASFIVIDTLVHNFLHRTRILQRFDADHPYGLACYHPGGCREILDLIAARIDALNAISLMSLGDSRRDTYVIRGPRSFEVLSGSAILGTDLASFGSRFEIVYLACFKEYLFSEPRNFRVQIGLVSHPCRKRYHMST